MVQHHVGAERLASGPSGALMDGEPDCRSKRRLATVQRHRPCRASGPFGSSQGADLPIGIVIRAIIASRVRLDRMLSTQSSERKARSAQLVRDGTLRDVSPSTSASFLGQCGCGTPSDWPASEQLGRRPPCISGKSIVEVASPGLISIAAVEHLPSHPAAGEGEAVTRLAFSTAVFLPGHP